MMNGKLIEIAKGSVSNRSIIIPSKELGKHLAPETELYRSYFSFDEKIKEHINSGRKTPSGYIGNFYLDYLVLDIDKGSDTLEFTIQRTRDVVDKLLKEYDLEDNFQIWFSGTGFHIHCVDFFGFEPSPTLPNTVRETIETHLPEVDSKPIQSRGLIRVGYSYNAKSKLYKVPIKESDIWFLTEEKVLELASTQNTKLKSIKFNNAYQVHNHLIREAKEPNEKLELPSHRPSNIVTCMQTCYTNGEVVGTRHERILRMVSWQRRNGTPPEAVFAMMKEYAPSMDKYELEKIVRDTYQKGYVYSCDDKVMKQFCSPNCIFYTQKNYTSEIQTANDLEKKMHTFAKGDWKKYSLNLREDFNLPFDFWVKPGDLVTFIGGTGLNKTSTVQNIVNRHKRNTLYLSTEFGDVLLYRRFCQIEHGLTEEEVIAHYQTHNNTLGTALGYCHFLRAVANSNEIVKMMKRMSYEVVVIDVIDDVTHPKYVNGGVASQEAIAPELKLIAEQMNCIVILVHHISKASAYDDDGNPKELTVHSGKGSSAFEQKSDIVIGIQGKQEENLRTVRSLKARDNKPFRKRIQIDTKTFKYEVLEQ